MAMAIDWSGVSYDEKRDARSEGVPLDAALRDVLGKHDDRLLRDAGLTRESVLGEEAAFWRDWSRRRAPWSL